MKKILIVGATGKIGQSLFDFLKHVGYVVFGTSHRSGTNLLPFNLTLPDSLPQGCEGASHAIICAGSTNIRRCEENPKETYQTNVLGTITLVEKLLEQGSRPILFSSDYVFDGEKGGYVETDSLHPVNEYGRQKAELDCRLSEMNCVVFRLSKVFGIAPGDHGLIDEMVQKMQCGKTVLAATDQIFSPLFLEDLHSAVHKVIEGTYNGLYHLCGSETRSRYEIASSVAHKIGAPLELVTPISIEDLKEPFLRPKDTSMKAHRWMQESGMTLSSLSVCLNRLPTIYPRNRVT